MVILPNLLSLKFISFLDNHGLNAKAKTEMKKPTKKPIFIIPTIASEKGIKSELESKTNSISRVRPEISKKSKIVPIINFEEKIKKGFQAFLSTIRAPSMSIKKNSIPPIS